MKRRDRVIVPDNYERYERLEKERERDKRLAALERKVKELEEMLLAK
jgi:hypothetical protein